MSTIAPPQLGEVAVELPQRVGRTQLASAALVVALPLISVVVAVVIFWNHGIGWLDLGLAVGMYVFTGMVSASGSIASSAIAPSCPPDG